MFLNMTGAIVHYQVSGDPARPAILFWNGAGCSLQMWNNIVKRLKEDFYLIRFDVRGTGRSSATANPAREYSFEQYADDVISILNSLGVDVCHVWAMAWGSRAALAFCALQQARVRSAAFFDLSIGKADVEAQQQQSRVARKKQYAAGIVEEPAPLGWNQHNHPEEVPKALSAAARYDLRAAAANLALPVLVATGDHDPNLASSREFVAMTPSASLVVMPDVGHGSVLQRPGLTTAIYEEFLKRHV